MMAIKQLVFCLDCCKCIGEGREGYAEFHLKEFPDHRKYFTKTIIDPLQLSDMEFNEYCARLKPYHPIWPPELAT